MFLTLCANRGGTARSREIAGRRMALTFEMGVQQASAWVTRATDRRDLLIGRT